MVWFRENVGWLIVRRCVLYFEFALLILVANIFVGDVYVSNSFSGLIVFDALDCWEVVNFELRFVVGNYQFLQ